MEQTASFTTSQASSSLDVRTTKDQDKSGSEWDEEVELEFEEHDLFLKNHYVNPNSNHMLPTKAHQHQNEFRSRTPNGLSHSSRTQEQHNLIARTHDNNEHENSTRLNMEYFHVDDSEREPSPIIYQVPNNDRFAGNLAPTSPTSVLVSFVIIFVILTVTIVPKIIPQSSSVYDDDDAYHDYDYNLDELPDHKVIDDKKMSKSGAKVPPPLEMTAQPQDHYKSMHPDVRCKCICPPFPSSNDTKTPSALQTNQRRLYVGNTSPDQCNCFNIVRPHFKTDTKILLKDFCVRCQCKYQSRNTRTIMRNVVFFIAVLTGIALYMIIQYVLKHFRITRRALPPNLRWLHHQLDNDNY